MPFNDILHDINGTNDLKCPVHDIINGIEHLFCKPEGFFVIL